MVVDDDGKERASVDYPGNSRRYLRADSPCHSAKGYRRIASRTGLFRNTVRKYPSTPKAGSIAKDGSSSSDDQLSRLATIGQPGPRQAETPNEDLLAPWADPIYQWLTGDRLQVTRIHELQLGRGCPVSYQSPRGFVQKRNWNRPSRTAGRPEDSPPGKVSELDVGLLVLIRDPETGRRRTAGRRSRWWAIPGTASSGPPSVRRCRT